MSESLAGITVAAIAVVVLVTSIFDKGNIGLVPDDWYDQDSVVTCAFCNAEACPYYVFGRPGLTIRFDGDPDTLPYDLYDMNGFTDRYSRDNLGGGVIITDDQQRIVMQLQSGSFQWPGPAEKSRNYTSDLSWEENNLPEHSGVFLSFLDDKSDDYAGFFLVFLAYGRGGIDPDYDPNLLQEKFKHFVPVDVQPMFRSIPIDGIPNAEIHIYTDLGQNYLDLADSCLDVQVIPDVHQVYPLGKTMQVLEDDFFYRDFNDHWQSSGTHEIAVQAQSSRQILLFWADFETMRYSHTYQGDTVVDISFAAGDWPEIFALYQELNLRASNTGHQVYFPMGYEGDLEVHGITYECYYAYSDLPVSDTNGLYSITYFFVPKQECNISISMSELITYEQLQQILRNPDPQRHIEYGAPLECIMLR